jgi:hypothetical protein
MPGRFPGTDKDEASGAALKNVAATPQEWREPPGYLGEAVRRAKRIASLSQSVGSSQPITEDR